MSTYFFDSKWIILYIINLSKNKSFKYVKAYYRLFLFFKKRLKRLYEDFRFYRNLRLRKYLSSMFWKKHILDCKHTHNKLNQMKG